MCAAATVDNEPRRPWPRSSATFLVELWISLAGSDLWFPPLHNDLHGRTWPRPRNVAKPTCAIAANAMQRIGRRRESHMYCSCPVQSRNWATHPLPLYGFVVCMSTIGRSESPLPRPLTGSTPVSGRQGSRRLGGEMPPNGGQKPTFSCDSVSRAEQDDGTL